MSHLQVSHRKELRKILDTARYDDLAELSQLARDWQKHGPAVKALERAMLDVEARLTDNTAAAIALEQDGSADTQFRMLQKRDSRSGQSRSVEHTLAAIRDTPEAGVNLAALLFDGFEPITPVSNPFLDSDVNEATDTKIRAFGEQRAQGEKRRLKVPD